MVPATRGRPSEGTAELEVAGPRLLVHSWAQAPEVPGLGARGSAHTAGPGGAACWRSTPHPVRGQVCDRLRVVRISARALFFFDLEDAKFSSPRVCLPEFAGGVGGGEWWGGGSFFPPPPGSHTSPHPWGSQGP